MSYIRVNGTWFHEDVSHSTPGCGYNPDVDPDAPTTFEAGDIVYLASGSPALTVLSACDECGDVEVAWFDGDSMQSAVLPDVTLVAEE